MSSKRTRSSPAEKQVQSNGVKQSLTHNDSIERLVDELLDSSKGNKDIGCNVHHLKHVILCNVILCFVH